MKGFYFRYDASLFTTTQVAYANCGHSSEPDTMDTVTCIAQRLFPDMPQSAIFWWRDRKENVIRMCTNEDFAAYINYKPHLVNDYLQINIYVEYVWPDGTAKVCAKIAAAVFILLVMLLYSKCSMSDFAIVS